MFWGARVLFRQAGQCLRSRSSLLAIATGSLFFLYTRPPIHLDTPNMREESILHRLIEHYDDLFDPHEVINRHLKERETAYKVNRARTSHHYNYVNSDPHCPQASAIFAGKLGPESRCWQFTCLFGGHHGQTISRTFSNEFVKALWGNLQRFYEEYNDGFEFDTLSVDGTRWRDPPPDQIDDAIVTAFRVADRFHVLRLVDDALSSESATSRGLAFNNLQHALSGSTALISFYDNQTRQLRVACTGTSRALLGRRTKDERGDTIYEVHVLSEDQTPDNPKEVARIQSEHPGEALFKDGRYLGLPMTRAFGHAHLKLPREAMERMRHFDGPTVDEPLPAGAFKTPPYLTAEPVIVTMDVQPGDFLVMATEGLWQWLTNAEVVGLMGMFLDQPKARRSGYEDPLSRDALPVRIDKDDSPRWKRWKTQREFVNVDSNAATHLIRNALGASNTDIASALLSLRPPWAQQYYDDMLIFVTFFDE